MAKKNAADSDDDDIVARAKALYKIDKDHWDSLVYDKAKSDLKFLSDEDGAQWDGTIYNARKASGLTTAQVDYLTQYIHQVANDIRQNERQADVVPVGSQASKDTAEVIKGLLKQIQYKSCSDEVYDTAVEGAIKCSIGYIKIDHDYEDESGGFDQELCLKRVTNPFVIYPDSTSIESDGRDMQHCTELEKISVSEFKRRWPDAEVTDFERDNNHGGDYKEDDEVTIAHFQIRSSDEELIESDDGKAKRTVTKYTINRYKLSGSEVLEKTTFPGKYIGYVPVYGEECWEDGKRKLHSLIRKAKEPQMLYNLLTSVNTDILLKQPQASVMVAAGAIENYADDWIDPSKSMALRYEVFDEQERPLPPPQRLAPPQISSGLVSAMEGSINDIRGVLGMYQASVGQNGPEVSGKAINARKIEGDVATYHFGDNLVRSMTQVCRVLVSAAPIIYDTPRMIQILNAEDEPELIGINGLTPQGQEAMHDFSKGAYDVRVTVGASFTTQRQQTEEFLKQFLTANPQMMQVFGDLFFKNADFAGASQLESRMQKVMNPQLFQDNGQNPQIMALMQQLQQAQGTIQQLQAQLHDKSTDQQIKMAGVQAKVQDSQLKHLNTVVKTAADTSTQSRGLDLQEQKQAADIVMGAVEMHNNNVIDQMNRVERQTLPHGNPSANSGGGVQGTSPNGKPSY